MSELLFGMQVITSDLCTRMPTPGEEARRIVRHGLADVLEWLGEPVGPSPSERIPAAYLVNGDLLAHPRVVHLLRPAGERPMSKHPRCKVTGKLRFETFALAVHAALTSSKKRGVSLRVYSCEHCGDHHLTKRPANPAVATVPGPFTPTDMARLAGRRQETA